MMKGLENLLEERTMSGDCSAQRSHRRVGSSDGERGFGEDKVWSHTLRSEWTRGKGHKLKQRCSPEVPKHTQ